MNFNKKQFASDYTKRSFVIYERSVYVFSLRKVYFLNDVSN